MKIGIAQIDSKVGDFPANAKRILQAYRACLDEGADLVVTPAYALCGYPLYDLALQERFISKTLQALDYLGDEVKDVPLLVGYADLISGAPTKSAALLRKGEMTQWIHYSNAQEEVQCIDLDGEKIGVRVDRYGSVKSGVELVVHLAAERYQYGARDAQKLDAATQVVCNAAGVNDGWVFRGGSHITSPSGELQCSLPLFGERVYVADVTNGESIEGEPYEFEMLYQALVAGVKGFVEKGQHDEVCLVDDGSLDAYLVARIAEDSGCQYSVLCSGNMSLLGDERTGSQGRLVHLDMPEVSDEQMGYWLQATLSRHSESNGSLQLSCGSRTKYLLGDTGCIEHSHGGLAVLGDLPNALIHALAKWLNEHRFSIPEQVLASRKYHKDTDLILEHVLRGASAEEVISLTGHSEHFVRSVVRRYNLGALKRRYQPITLQLVTHSPERLPIYPVNQTFID